MRIAWLAAVGFVKKSLLSDVTVFELLAPLPSAQASDVGVHMNPSRGQLD